MRILMIEPFRPAGRCRGTFSLAGELGRQGYRVSVFFPGAPPGAPEQFGRRYRVPVIAGWRPEEITWLLKHESFDLIHLQGLHLLRRGSSLTRALEMCIRDSIKRNVCA